MLKMFVITKTVTGSSVTFKAKSRGNNHGEAIGYLHAMNLADAQKKMFVILGRVGTLEGIFLDTKLKEGLLPPEENMLQRLSRELDEAEHKAHTALAGYKFILFGYWAAIWVHLNQISGAKKGNPFKPYVDLAARLQKKGKTLPKRAKPLQKNDKTLPKRTKSLQVPAKNVRVSKRSSPER